VGKQNGKRKSTKAGKANVEQAPPVPAGGIAELVRVGPGFDLAALDPGRIVAGPDDRDLAREQAGALEPLVSELQERLWADAKVGGKRSLLIVLQGMDTSGKGGAAKAVDVLLDPMGFGIVSFGKPSEEERSHHYLWRHRRELPEPGKVRLHDRSHYETVLVERVRNLVASDVWQARYDEINEWEAELVAGGTTILKCMLHLSKDEQKQRLLDRLADPTKHWKYNPGDVDERALWDDYEAAYQDALVRCSTDAAPWYVIPADRKWHRDWILSHLLLETLQAMNPKYPPATFDVDVELSRVAAS